MFQSLKKSKLEVKYSNKAFKHYVEKYENTKELIIFLERYEYMIRSVHLYACIHVLSQFTDPAISMKATTVYAFSSNINVIQRKNFII